MKKIGKEQVRKARQTLAKYKEGRRYSTRESCQTSSGGN